MNLPLHISDESNYCWIQIPKCASSTIRTVLQKFTEKTTDDKYEWKKTYLTNKLKTRFNFTFVRNPFDRLVSCYSDKILNHTRWSDKKRQSDSIHYMIEHEYDFSEFVKKITTDFYGHDDHWLNCSKFIPHDYTEFGFIGKCENLKTDFEYVCENIKIPISELPKSNKTNHNHYTEYYTNELRKIVETRYADDIDRFSYKFGD